ncbi:hypothetical protein Bca52824_027896 [Brassica carinata]|uniref:Trichome birefringence-like C-terminal domain-containing protein n=1 Tax=Brassica carinata TaxID=52824 RepID=A0A8X7VBA1_BRACI|nr:hypothetical protein Bca52824_027896 [Brassica carinata]
MESVKIPEHLIKLFPVAQPGVFDLVGYVIYAVEGTPYQSVFYNRTIETNVFFNGVSPVHYDGRDWGEPIKSLKSHTQPFYERKYSGGPPVAWVILNKMMRRSKRPVYWLDITGLRQLRKDAHPSAYSGNHPSNDCSHWCLPGSPNTWNVLFYSALFS